MIADGHTAVSCCAAASTPQDLAQIFAFGLLMSAGHCLGMCGPLVCIASVPKEGRGAAASLALYHGGRVASYALLGALLGLAGGLMPAGADTIVWQGTLSLLAATGIVWVALGLFGLFPLAKSGAGAKLSGWLVRTVGGIGAGHGGWRRFALGAANGLLPCGPVYTVAVAAFAAGGATRGALAMGVYGLGTLPLLAALALGLRLVAPQLRLRFYRAGAALALVMGVQLGLRGMAALELVPHARIGEVVLW